MLDDLSTKEELTQEDLSTYFLDDPKLCWIGLPDSELAILYNENKYDMSTNSKYFGIMKNNELVCVVKYEMFSYLALCVHPYVSTKLRGKGLSKDIFDYIKKELIRMTGFKKVVITVPEPCVHVCKAIEKYGAVQEGRIKEIVLWRLKPVDLLFYRLELNG